MRCRCCRRVCKGDVAVVRDEEAVPRLTALVRHVTDGPVLGAAAPRPIIALCHGLGC